MLRLQPSKAFSTTPPSSHASCPKGSQAPHAALPAGRSAQTHEAVGCAALDRVRASCGLGLSAPTLCFFLPVDDKASVHASPTQLRWPTAIWAPALCSGRRLGRSGPSCLVWQDAHPQRSPSQSGLGAVAERGWRLLFPVSDSPGSVLWAHGRT